MANRRMFSLKVVDTDAFLDMPQSSQLLYYSLAMRADDDGFVSNPKKIMRIIGSQEDDLKVLVVKKFIIPFESGVCVIKHWLIHNLIRGDRYTETQWIREKQQLKIDEETGKYSLKEGQNEENDNLLEQNVIPNGNHSLPQVRVRLGKDRVGEGNIHVHESPDPLTKPKNHQIQMADLFEAFWDEYPVKKARKTAEAKWAKLDPNLASTIIEDVKKRKISDRAWLGGYIPHPTTYLNQERWNDEITPERRRSEPPLPIGTPHIPGKYLNVKVLKVPGKETK